MLPVFIFVIFVCLCADLSNKCVAWHCSYMDVKEQNSLHSLKLIFVSNFGFKFGVTYFEIMLSKFGFKYAMIWYEIFVSNFGFKFVSILDQMINNFGFIFGLQILYPFGLYSNLGYKYWLKICVQ